MLFPQIEGVTACSAAPGLELQWRDSKGQLLGLALPVDPQARDPEPLPGQARRVCATLTGKENWPDEARLAAPADAVLGIKLQQ